MNKTFLFHVFLFSGILFLFSCSKTENISPRESIDLSGTWQFALDSAGVGIQDKWFEIQLNEPVKLPGTLDENDKGIINTNRAETMRLSRERTFEGMAWYQKKINIENKWDGKEILLTLERTKPTKIWVDNNFAGESSIILTPQKFNVTRFLTPGEHTITILVNNGENSVPNGIKGSHAWTEHTQTNWNGIIGEILLEAIPKNYIQLVKVKPDTENKQANVTLKIINSGNEKINAKIKLNKTRKMIIKKWFLARKGFSFFIDTPKNYFDIYMFLIDTS